MRGRISTVAMSRLAALAVAAGLTLLLTSGTPAQSSMLHPDPLAAPAAAQSAAGLARSVTSGDNWTARTAMPTGRSLASAATLNGTIYVIGGWRDSALTTTKAYDPAADSWSSKAGMPTDRNALAATAVDVKVYAIGGWSSSPGAVTAAVEVYDPATDLWRTVRPLPAARNALAAVTLGGEIYAVGGWDGQGVTNTLTVYNPVSDTWRTRTSMPTARNGLAAAVVEGKLYAIGGFDGAAVTGKVEIYDLAADSWSTGAAMPTPRWLMGAAVLADKIYVVGGNQFGDFGAALAVNQEYDPATDAWRTVTAMPAARWGMAVAATGDRLYAIGGPGEDPSNEMYTPPALYRVHLPLHLLNGSSPPPILVSRPRFQVFILNPVRTCLVGNDFASGSVCRGSKCGDCDCRWEDFDPPAPLVGVPPARVNDPQYAGYQYKVCVEITLAQPEIDDIIADMRLTRDRVLAWSAGALDLQMEFTVLPHDHVGFVAPDFVFGPFEVDDELLNPYVTASTDFVYTVSGVYDRGLGVRLAYACGGSYGEMSVHGAGYANIQYNDICNSVTIAGRRVYEPLIHEWMHNLDWALYHVNLMPDLYQHVGPDWANWDPGPWPACNTGAADTYAWFPSVDYCEWDPDWIDCNNVASAGACLHAGEVSGGISWYEHVISAHYPRSVQFIGNHCRDGRRDFSETGVDHGGPCP